MASKKKGGSKFKGKTTSNAHKQKTQGSQYGYLNLPKGVNVFKEKPGDKEMLDTLPYVVTDQNHMDRNDENEIAVPKTQWYKKPFLLHRNIGANNDSYVCRRTIGKKCPICEFRAKRQSEGAEQEELGALKVSLRNLYYVTPLKNKDYDSVPHIWDISQYCYQAMLNDELEENEDNGVFPDLDEGLTLRVRFSKESFAGNSFAKTSRIDFDERDEQYGEDYIKNLPSLDDVLTIFDYDKLHNVFYELEDEPEPEEKVEGEPEPEENVQGKSESEPEESPKQERKPKDGGKSGGKKQDKPKTKMPENRDELEDMTAKQLKPIAKELGCSTDVDEIAEALGLDESEESSGEDEGKKQSTGGIAKDSCPHGYRFGVDCEEYEECDDCSMWDDCIEAKENS